jgi:hypothetical protein
MPKKRKVNLDVEAVDVPAMYDLSDEEYREFVSGGELVYVDKNQVLRSTPAGYPLAITVEQLDILIEELQRLRVKMVPRG